MSTNIVVLLALPTEHDVFKQHFPVLSGRDVSTGSLVRLEHYIEHVGFTLTSILASDMGADAAAVSLDSALTDLDPDLVICLGIAGSLNDDAMLGDVCLSSQIVDVLNNSKVVDQPIRRRKPTHQRPKTRSKVQTAVRTELSPRTYIVDEQLSAAPRFLRSQPLQASVLADLVKSLGERWSKFIDEEPKAAELVNAARTPEFHVGPIVCGPVTVSKEFKDRLRDHNRKILAVETESGTVFRVCEARKIPSVTIRGISDYADKNKTRLEQDLKDTLRRIAMANACDFFSAMLRNVMFLRAAVEHAQPGNAVTHMPVDDEELLFLNSRSAIQAHLERASAEYKNRPLDAPLPIPRVRRAAPGEDADEYQSSPRSVFEALNEDRRIFIKIPRSYPEANVAWYLGASLLQHEIDGKQIVPLVVDAQDIRPPAHTFVRELGVLATALERQNIQPVIIINEPEFDSDSRTKFLSDQIKSLGSVATIIVSKLEAPVETIDTFKVAGGFTDYLTASVPLAEIAGFLEKAFEMPPEEADVVATRLDDTFSKFRLHTHPAYFIGLQETAIEALIDANQRAELIQLAVDGILSFVVANDKSEFRVSRTTREEFLTELAVDLRIEKRAISKASLVARAEAFAEQKGLDIDSIEFIRGFFQFGLLSDVGHGVGYSLPFLESYLLAEKLTRDPAMASRYFNPSSDDFDEYTFDLYCELGPCLGVVQHVVQFAQTSFAKCATSKNILSTREIKPSALRTPQSLVSLAKRMSDATVKITAEASSSKVRVEKQKLIDTRQKVTATVGADKKKLRAEPPAELKEEFALLDDLSRSCTLLATMIGAGAERLNADCKREISKLLLQCSERFLDLWTRNRARLDFVEIRKELLSDKSVKSMKKQLGSFDDEDLDVRQILSLFIDDQELRILSSPLATILHRIASYAGVRSLRPIVLKLKTDSALEEIIRGSWMMEIDPDAGRSLVKAAFQAFKGSPVARLTTANHLMWRIFWHHWQSASRHSFASAAKAILAPLQIVPTADHSAKMLEGHRAANN